MSRGRRGGAGGGPGPSGLPKGQADEGADVAVSLCLCPPQHRNPGDSRHPLLGRGPAVKLVL